MRLPDVADLFANVVCARSRWCQDVTVSIAAELEGSTRSRARADAQAAPRPVAVDVSALPSARAQVRGLPSRRPGLQ